MKRFWNRVFYCGAIAATALLATSTGLVWLSKPVAAQTARPTGNSPVFEVDPTWPKALPNNWKLGPVSGISTDARDHIWVVHRVKQAPDVPAPDVIEFDPQGSIVQTWTPGSSAGYEWMEQVHGITVDSKDHVWISGNGTSDAHILEFNTTGKFLMQVGHQGKNGGSNDTANLGRSTQVRLDAERNEIYVSDGERNENHRVIVFDAQSGAYKRHWGAYGEKPDDSAVSATFDSNGPPPRQFSGAVHCVHVSRDGFVYVCDRGNDRFQIFRRDGTFVKEVFISKDTHGQGSVWDIEFSPDPAQKFMYVADGTNQKVWILLRETQQIIGSFGERGTNPGQFNTAVHDIAVDSKGNIYTGEAETGGRIQKFAIKNAGASK
jgi:hypothetical protein